MDILTTARKFSQSPSQCSDSEIAALATVDFLAHPLALQLIAVGNSHKTKMAGLQAEIRRAHFERVNWDSLVQNPFATEDEIKATPTPSDMAALPQSDLAAMVFGV